MSFFVNHHRGKTEVILGLPKVEDYRKESTIIIVDSFFKSNIFSLLSGFDDFFVYFIQTSESKKSILSASSILDDLLSQLSFLPLSIISVGGGIIQDITGLMASLIRRGISWTYVPSTLLSQGDSCIGSKISINSSSKKNSVGLFYSPNFVFIDSSFLKSLPPREVLSGIGDMLHYILLSKSIPKSFLDNDWINLEKSNLTILPLITSEVLKIKKKYIEIDEFDVSIRKHLNFGHSFAHALEVSCNFQLPHGIAVIQGLNISVKLASEFYPAHNMTFTESHYLLLSKALSLSVPYISSIDFDLNVFLKALKADKKNTIPGEFTFILPLNIKNKSESQIIDDTVSICHFSDDDIVSFFHSYPLFT